MAQTTTYVQVNTTQKRKRSADEVSEVADGLDRQVKRHLKQKPASKPVYVQLPIPDESSEDEDSRDARNHWYSRRNINSLTRIKTCSMSSIRVNLDRLIEEDDVMIISPATPGLSMLTCSTTYTDRFDSFCPPPTPFDERMDTPTTTSTPYRRNWSSQLHTMLSPVVGEECMLGSPVSPMDTEGMIAIHHHHHNSDMGYNSRKGLNVYYPVNSPTSRPEVQMVDVQDTSRTAKLHMGYRADCEKCVRKVPGHNSHILWS